MTTEYILSLLLRVLLLIACAAGTLRAVFPKERDAENAGGIWYYTIQSNLLVMLLTAVYLVLSIAAQFTGTFPAVRALEIARFAVAVGITITFLVFWLLLAPLMGKDYLKSLNNLLVHTLVPVLFILDFFLFHRISTPSAGEALWCLMLPLYYSVLTYAHAALNPKLRFQGDSRYPYFFMDAEALGWFRLQKNPGVVWWMLFNLGLTLGLGYLFRFLLTAIQ